MRQVKRLGRTSAQIERRLRRLYPEYYDDVDISVTRTDYPLKPEDKLQLPKIGCPPRWIDN
jgi:hypothetical protein